MYYLLKKSGKKKNFSFSPSPAKDDRLGRKKSAFTFKHRKNGGVEDGVPSALHSPPPSQKKEEEGLPKNKIRGLSCLEGEGGGG